MPNQKQYYTTGQVAKICNVSPRLAMKWIDSGNLKGFRLPESKDRRVARADLAEFLLRHKMPQLPDTTERVLYAGYPSNGYYSIHLEIEDRIATGLLEIGQIIGSENPPIVIVLWLDSVLGSHSTLESLIHKLVSLPHKPTIIGIVPEDQDPTLWNSMGVWLTLKNPSKDELRSAVEKAKQQRKEHRYE